MLEVVADLKELFNDLLRALDRFFTAQRTESLVRALVIVVIGLLAARFAGRAVRRFISSRADPQRAILIQRLVAWGLFFVSLAWALQELGFQLGVVLGAAGIVTVAVGFAAQTTLSNIISGFFLFGERPFKTGDLIEVDGVTGEVLSVDLMSTKIRTFQNHYVRIPNELVLKTKVSNLTRFPLRRIDLNLALAYDEDLELVRELLLDVVRKNAYCLVEPEPLFLIMDFEESRMRLLFGVWTQTQNFVLAWQSVAKEIKEAFGEHGIRIPYPHRILHQKRGDSSDFPKAIEQKREVVVPSRPSHKRPMR